MQKQTKKLLWGLVLIALVGASLRGINMFENFFLPSSQTETPIEEIPVFNIANRPDHPFYAVGDQVILAVEVDPPGATDQTIVWSSSNSELVSVTKLTDTTARVKAEAWFSYFSSVIITATATQGTESTHDDVSAQCTVSMYTAVTDVEIEWYQNSQVNSGISGSYVDIDDIFWVRAKIYPLNTASYNDFDMTYDDEYLIFNDPYENHYFGDPWSIEFEFLATLRTMPGETTTVEIVLNDLEETTFSIDIQIGRELNPGNELKDNDREIKIYDEILGETTITYHQYITGIFYDMFMINLPSTTDTNVIELILPYSDAKYTDFEIIEWENDEFELFNVQVIPNSTLKNTGGTGTRVIVSVIDPDEVTKGKWYAFEIVFEFYDITIDLPFMFSNPVTGLSLSDSEITF